MFSQIKGVVLFKLHKTSTLRGWRMHPNSLFSIKFLHFVVIIPKPVCLSHWEWYCSVSGSVTGPESLAKSFASFLAQKLFEAPYRQFSYEMCLPHSLA